MMYKIMDVTADFSFLYFILIILFLCIISLNLIAAILASRFGLLRMDHEQQLEMERQLAMQDGEDDRPDLQDAILKAKEMVAAQGGDAPKLVDERGCLSKFRGCMHSLVTKDWFVNTSGILILLYCLMLCLKHANQSDLFDSILKFGDMGFSVVFLIELIFKLIGYEWKVYFANGFNIFDAIIIVCCFVDVWVLAFVSDSVAVLRVFRVFRVSRVFVRVPRVQVVLSEPRQPDVGSPSAGWPSSLLGHGGASHNKRIAARTDVGIGIGTRKQQQHRG